MAIFKRNLRTTRPTAPRWKARIEICQKARQKRVSVVQGEGQEVAWCACRVGAVRTEGRRAGRCTHVARARTRIASISHFRAGWDGDGGKGGGKGGGGEAEGEEDGDNGEGGEAQRVVNGGGGGARRRWRWWQRLASCHISTWAARATPFRAVLQPDWQKGGREHAYGMRLNQVRIGRSAPMSTPRRTRACPCRLSRPSMERAKVSTG